MDNLLRPWPSVTRVEKRGDDILVGFSDGTERVFIAAELLDKPPLRKVYSRVLKKAEGTA